MQAFDVYQRAYELHDHLGNVRMVTSDQVWYNGMYNNVNPGGFYTYYAFGSLMPAPYWDRLSDNGYKFGFNSQERDDYISGSGNSMAFKFREQDTRIGRFMSVDPLATKYPYWSPYAFAGNRPIDGGDLEGREWENFMSKFKTPGELKIKVPDEKSLQKQHFEAVVDNSKMSFKQITHDFKAHPEIALTNSKAKFNSPVDKEGNAALFKTGNYIKIDIKGPMNNGYVKVLDIVEKKDYLSATFVTMEGHIEKGIINFNIVNLGNNSIKFEINSMSNVDQGVAKLPILKDIARSEQKASWNEVLDNAVKYTGGQEEKDKRQTIVTEAPKKN